MAGLLQNLAAFSVRGGAALVAVLVMSAFQPAVADCIAISTPADFDNLRNNPAGNFCLANDIDLTGLTWTPIENFAGTLSGNGHAVANLESTAGGLFDNVDGAAIQDLSLTNVSIVVQGSPFGGSVGGLANYSTSSTITNVSVTGYIECDVACDGVGSIIGFINRGSALVTDSWSSATVVGLFDANGGAAGGLVGFNKGGTLDRTYFAGSITCGDVSHRSNACSVGGLVGENEGTIQHSYALEQVTVDAGFDSYAGGLVGVAGNNRTGGDGRITQSYAMANINAANAYVVGGLVGMICPEDSALLISETYATGAISGTANFVGGLVGYNRAQGCNGSTETSYWDTDTTGQTNSTDGEGLTTSELQAELPAGFDPNVWGITPGESYPYLLDSDFSAALSSQVLPVNNANTKGPYPRAASVRRTTSLTNLLYVFLPINQFDQSQYDKPVHVKQAALAATYTIVARAIGITQSVADLRDVKIDKYFWDGKHRTAIWQGPVTQYANLSEFIPLSEDAHLDDSNVVGHLKQRQLVILRGTKPNGPTSWFLATLYTTYQAGKRKGQLERVVALDPGSGKQIFVNPTTKKIGHNIVDGYVVVTLQ